MAIELHIIHHHRRRRRRRPKPRLPAVQLLPPVQRPLMLTYEQQGNPSETAMKFLTAAMQFCMRNRS
jgi:hypothetical protein